MPELRYAGGTLIEREKGRTLKSLADYYGRLEDRGGQEVLLFMLRKLRLIARARIWEPSRALAEYKARIEAPDGDHVEGRQNRGVWVMHWEQLSRELQRFLVNELAEKLPKNVLDLDDRDFNAPDNVLEGIGQGLSGMLKYYEKYGAAHHIEKTPRWILFDALGYFDDQEPPLASLADMKTSEDLGRAMRAKALLYVPWEFFLERNLTLLRELIIELAGHAFYHSYSPGIRQRVIDNSDVLRLTPNHFIEIELPGLGRNLKHLYCRFEQGPSGSVLESLLKRLFPELCEEVPDLSQAYRLESLQHLHDVGRLPRDHHRNNVFVRMPDSAKRALIHELSVREKRDLDSSPPATPEYDGKPLDSIGRNLARMLDTYNQKRPADLTGPLYILDATGFLRREETLLKAFELTAKGFNYFRRNGHAQAASFSYFEAHQADFHRISTAADPKDLRVAFEQALRHADTAMIGKLTGLERRAIGQWREGILAYWSALDTLEWMPKTFERVVLEMVSTNGEIIEDLPDNLVTARIIQIRKKYRLMDAVLQSQGFSKSQAAKLLFDHPHHLWEGSQPEQIALLLQAYSSNGTNLDPGTFTTLLNRTHMASSFNAALHNALERAHPESAAVHNRLYSLLIHLSGSNRLALNFTLGLLFPDIRFRSRHQNQQDIADFLLRVVEDGNKLLDEKSLNQGEILVEHEGDAGFGLTQPDIPLENGEAKRLVWVKFVDGTKKLCIDSLYRISFLSMGTVRSAMERSSKRHLSTSGSHRLPELSLSANPSYRRNWAGAESFLLLGVFVGIPLTFVLHHLGLFGGDGNVSLLLRGAPWRRPRRRFIAGCFPWRTDSDGQTNGGISFAADNMPKRGTPYVSWRRFFMKRSSLQGLLPP